jgi:DNA-binding IclR family transcriptional regulator
MPSEEGPAAQAGAAITTLLDLMELLAGSPRAMGVSDVARSLGLSKARSHRNLRALVDRGYARQDPDSGRYGAGIKLLVLGEMVREQFGIAAAARPEMERLREATGQAVTISTLVGDAVTVIELLQGRTVVEFGIRPGTQMALHASAHGRVALAFGPPAVLDRCTAAALPAWTPMTTTDPDVLRAEVAAVRAQGWATADGQVLIGVNALAAPIFDHTGGSCGSIALVGSSQFIPASPDAEQIAQVIDAARRVSQRLGYARS